MGSIAQGFTDVPLKTTRKIDKEHPKPKRDHENESIKDRIKNKGKAVKR